MPSRAAPVRRSEQGHIARPRLYWNNGITAVFEVWTVSLWLQRRLITCQAGFLRLVFGEGPKRIWLFLCSSRFKSVFDDSVFLTWRILYKWYDDDIDQRNQRTTLVPVTYKAPCSVKAKGKEYHTHEECWWGAHLAYLGLEPVGG